MKKISRLLTYLTDYKGKIALYFMFNLFSILFGLLSLTMLVPVLKVLFDNNAGQPVVAAKTAPAAGFIDHYIEMFKNLILSQDRVTALAYICIIVVVFTILKNLFLYLALYILNPLRNAVLRRLRD